MQGAAFVTGGSRGIGFATARRLAEFGWDLTLAARGRSDLESAANELARHGTRVCTVAADVSTDAGVEEAVEKHLGFHSGRSDLVVLCAGLGRVGKLDSYPTAHIQRQLAANFIGPFLTIQRLLPSLRWTATNHQPDRGAKIIALASISGVVPEPDAAAYSASKSALISLCGSVSIAEGKNGVTATAISPAFVDTQMTTWVRDKVNQSEMIHPSDVVELILAVTRLSRQATVTNLVVQRTSTHPWRA